MCPWMSIMVFWFYATVTVYHFFCAVHFSCPPPPPILRLYINLFAVAEGWLLLDIGWFVLFRWWGMLATQLGNEWRVIMAYNSFVLVFLWLSNFLYSIFLHVLSRYDWQEMLNPLEHLVSPLIFRIPWMSTVVLDYLVPQYNSALVLFILHRICIS